MWRCCKTRRPERLILFKLAVDLLISVVWLPVMLNKSAHVYRQTCSPLWRAERCDAFAADSYERPVFFFVGVVVVELVVYLVMFRALHNVLGRRSNSSALSRHTIYSYFLVFLWLHVYVSCAWIVYAWSMHLTAIVPLICVGIAQDAWIMTRVSKLRERNLYSNSGKHMQLSKMHVDDAMSSDEEEFAVAEERQGLLAGRGGGLEFAGHMHRSQGGRFLCFS